MRIVSWNINGIRAAEKKGFSSWLRQTDADVVLVQETRARPNQVPESLRTLARWEADFVAAQRPGYSGVGYFARKRPEEVLTSLGEPDIDAEGRLQLLRFERLWIVNGYFPNGSGRQRDNSRVPFKLHFYRALFKYLDLLLRGGERVVVAGDFNTAHAERDLARPKENAATSGFLLEEREELDRWLRSGWTDAFRLFVDEGGHYTWWSQRFGVRERNIGWRIDYTLVSDAVRPFVREAGIHPDVQGSDHCPITLELRDDVLRR